MEILLKQGEMDFGSAKNNEKEESRRGEKVGRPWVFARQTSAPARIRGDPQGGQSFSGSGAQPG
jgi:hypothetical protein